VVKLCDSVAQHLPWMHKTLGLIHSTPKNFSKSLPFGCFVL
jgi:hypothetical protein